MLYLWIIMCFPWNAADASKEIKGFFYKSNKKVQMNCKVQCVVSLMALSG